MKGKMLPYKKYIVMLFSISVFDMQCQLITIIINSLVLQQFNHSFIACYSNIVMCVIIAYADSNLFFLKISLKFSLLIFK